MNVPPATSRKGQAALEYVTTYGWAFLVILVMIGALAYFGVLNPSRWVPDKCDLGEQLECVDYQLDAASGTANLFVRNNFGKPVEIVGAAVKLDDGTLKGTFALDPPGALSVGGTADVTIDDLNAGATSLSLQAGEKRRLIVSIDFKKEGAPAENVHTLTGLLYTTAK